MFKSGNGGEDLPLINYLIFMWMTIQIKCTFMGVDRHDHYKMLKGKVLREDYSKCLLLHTDSEQHKSD